MSKKLNLNHLKEMREELSKTIKVVKEEADKARARNVEGIDDSQWQQAKDKWGKLETKESELQGLINNLELTFILNTNVNSPYSQIAQATNSLKTAAKDIKKFENFLDKIAKVFVIFDNTIKVIKTGGLLTLSA